MIGESFRFYAIGSQSYSAQASTLADLRHKVQGWFPMSVKVKIVDSRVLVGEQIIGFAMSSNQPPTELAE